MFLANLLELPSNLQMCNKFLVGCNADTEDKQYRVNKTQLGVEKASGVKCLVVTKKIIA